MSFNILPNFHFLTDFFNYIFNPTFGFVHIWPKFGLKQPSIFRVETNHCDNLVNSGTLFPIEMTEKKFPNQSKSHSSALIFEGLIAYCTSWQHNEWIHVYARGLLFIFTV